MLPYNNNNNVHQQLSLGRVTGGNSFQATTATTSRLSSANGLPLNLLVDAAISKVPVSVGPPNYSNNNNKRSFQDSSVDYSSPMKRSTFLLQQQQQQQQKKPRVASTPAAATQVSSLAINNPILMERLCSLSGGFPMPKFGGLFKKKDNKAAITDEALKVCQELQEERRLPTSKSGAFPMPSCTPGGRHPKSLAPKSLPTFEKIWTDIDNPQLRKEIFARKLQKGGL